MNRRDFLQAAGIVSAGLAFPDTVGLLAKDSAPAANWCTFEITTRVEILKPSGATRIWLPAALTTETPFQRTLSNSFHAEAGSAKLIERKPDSLALISVEFPEGAKPVVTSTSRISTKSYSVDLSSPVKSAKPPKQNRSDLDHFLRPTKLIPTDGVVKAKSDEIIVKANAHSDVE